MARARFIRPEFFTDTKLSDMPMGACLLFAGIWCHSDLHGVFEYDARTLRGLIFPMREDVSTADVAAWLGLLCTAGMVRAGCRHGADCKKTWGVVVNWDRHQSISGSESKWGSKRPKPCDITAASSMPAVCQTQAATLTLTPTLTPTPTPTPTPAPVHEYDEDFERWWEIYRRKGNKIQSGRQWEKLTPQEKTEAIDRTPIYVRGREKKYQKDGERFLRDKHWQNEHEEDQTDPEPMTYPTLTAENFPQPTPPQTNGEK